MSLEMPDDSKAREAERIERERFHEESQREYLAAHRRLNRKERRKLASEISKVEGGDYVS